MQGRPFPHRDFLMFLLLMVFAFATLATRDVSPTRGGGARIVNAQVAPSVTNVLSSTVIPSSTFSPTASLTPTLVVSQTSTVTPTAMRTSTATLTRTPTLIATAIVTPTATSTPVPTSTATSTLVHTPTLTATATRSRTPTTIAASATLTRTPTITATATLARTPTMTVTATATRTSTITGTRTLTATFMFEADVDATLGGELNVENGQVVVQFPGGALNVAHRIRFEKIKLPASQAQTHWQPILYKFSLRAFERARPTQETKQFKKPVTIRVRYEPAWVKESAEKTLVLVYWDESKKRWTVLPSMVDTRTRTVTAQTMHFTDFGLTTAPEIQSWLPNLIGAQPNLFMGSAATEYPIQVPPGRNGLTPKLALSYSSASVDMMDRTQQASFVGAGWSFSTSYIARNTRQTYEETDDVFTLSLDGAGYDLVRDANNPNLYHTTTEQYWRITFDSTNNRWLVTTNDGTQYQYGYSTNSRAVQWRWNYAQFRYPQTYAWWLERVLDTHGNEIVYSYRHDTATTDCAQEGASYQYDDGVYPELIRYNKVGTSYLTEIALTYSGRRDYYAQATAYQCAVPQQKSRLDRIDIRTTVGGSMQLVRAYVFEYDYSTFPGVWTGWPSNWYGRLTLKQIKHYGTDGTTLLPIQTFTYTGNRISQIANGIGGSVSHTYNTAVMTDTGSRRWAGWDFRGCGDWRWTSFPCQYYGAVNGSATIVVGGDDLGALSITSNGTGYGFLNAFSFIPGATYGFNAQVYPGYNEPPARVRLTLFDGISETLLQDWNNNCWSWQWGCGLNGLFRLSDAANQLQIRIYVDGTVGTQVANLYLYPTYYRVANRTIADGQGNTATFAYAYEGATMNHPGISNNYWDGRHPWYTLFRGHSKVTITDPTGTKVENYFAQDDIQAGRVLTMTQTNASGALFTRVQNTYAAVSIPVARVASDDRSNFVYLSQTIHETFDGQPTAKTTKTTYAYDAYGNLSQQDEYDHNNILYRRTVRTVYPNTTAWIVNQVGRVQVKTASDALVSETRYFYDGATNYTTPPTKGDLTRVDVTADGTNFFPQTRNTFDAYGNIISTTDARGNTTTTEFDTIYNIFPSRATNAVGHQTTNTYDYRLGKLLTTTDPNNATTTYEYDVFGRTAKIWLPLQQGHANPTVRYTYTLGNPRSLVRVEVRNDEGITNNTATYQSAWWFYDGLGRVIQQQAPAQASGQILLVNKAYDSRGNVWRISNPYAVSASGGTYQTPNWSQPYTEHLYDAIGRKHRINNPDGTFQTIAYNQWTTTFTDANNHQKQTVADAFGRTIQVKELNAGQTYTTDYTYDLLNRLTQVWDAASPRNLTTMTYDWLGRKIAMSDPDLGAWSYAYDNAGNLTRQTDAKNQTTCFYYDSLNRLKGKNYRGDPNCPPTDPGTYAVTYTYDTGTNGKGRRTGMSNAVASTMWTYDLQGAS